MRKLLLAAVVLALSVGGLEAHRYRLHHKHDREVTHIATARAWGVNWTSNSMAVEAGHYLGSNPIGWAHNWCGRFMKMIALKLGYQPPPDADAAIQWIHFGSPAPEGAPGSIMVMHHHVGIVLEMLPGRRVLLRSGNHGHRVADGVYPMARAVAWRRPS